MENAFSKILVDKMLKKKKTFRPEEECCIHLSRIFTKDYLTCW